MLFYAIETMLFFRNCIYMVPSLLIVTFACPRIFPFLRVKIQSVITPTGGPKKISNLVKIFGSLEQSGEDSFWKRA